MSSKAKHRNWWVKLPGRDPFSMGGEEMTEAEALATAKGIWPRDDVKVEPSMPKASSQGTPGAA
jgi:hypothetical protein